MKVNKKSYAATFGVCEVFSRSTGYVDYCPPLFSETTVPMAALCIKLAAFLHHRTPSTVPLSLAITHPLV